MSKKLLVDELDAGVAQPGGEYGGHPVRTDRDPAQPVGTVPHGVHPGDDREQHLRGADVARGLLAPDVLLAGLEGEAVGGGAVGVDGHADEPAGQAALEARADGEVARVGAAEPEGYAETLRRPDRHVEAVLARRAQQGQGEQVGGGDRESAPLVGGGDEGRVVTQGAAGAGVLDENAEDPADVATRR